MGLFSGIKKAVSDKVYAYQDKKQLVSGLNEDFSTTGKNRRFWLDDLHYIVFNPDTPFDAPERAQIMKSIEDFKCFGIVTGSTGELHRVILAGEVELATRKKQANPRITQQQSQQMEAMGKYLRDTSLFPDKKSDAPVDYQELQHTGGMPRINFNNEFQSGPIPTKTKSNRVPQRNAVNSVRVDPKLLQGVKDAVSALVSLGYGKKEASEAVEKAIRSGTKPAAPLLVKEALVYLSQGC
jgi:hypothetical protein